MARLPPKLKRKIIKSLPVYLIIYLQKYDSIKIPAAYLGFSTTASSKKRNYSQAIGNEKLKTRFCF